MPSDLPVPPATGDPSADAAGLLAWLHSRAKPENAAGMARFGITGAEVLGISVKELRALARGTLLDRKAEASWRHELAERLWASAVHEARLLAIFVDDPALFTEEQAERWVRDADSWDIVDQLCIGALKTAPFAPALAGRWARRDQQFVKRAGFALMAVLARQDRSMPDEAFEPFLALVETEADDDRNFVRKAVNWALRWIGERSAGLHADAVAVAERIRDRDSSRAARWVAADALRELTSETVRSRLGLPPV